MSPEQARGDGNVGSPSDVFSLGIILYWLFTGKKPFDGSSVYNLLRAIQHEEPPVPSEINTSLTKPFDLICRKALAKKPEHRFESMQEFAYALDSLRDSPVRSDGASVERVGRRTVSKTKKYDVFVSYAPSDDFPDQKR